MSMLEAAVSGDRNVFLTPAGRLHEQVTFRPNFRSLETSEVFSAAAIILSGGVGELVYAHLQGKSWPTTTYFGDLGIDLARRLIESSSWLPHFHRYQPASAGRAMVYGLLRHSTQISGSTLFLPHPEILPLRDLPILGTITDNAADEHLGSVLDLVQRSPRGGCLRLQMQDTGPKAVKALAGRIASELRAKNFPPHLPLVLFVPQNLGKVLGHYITDWGALPLALVVVDEIAVTDAQYAHLGALREQVVPV